MATTSIPWNRVMNARREGLALPPDVAVDAQGESTQDALGAAALRPLGGADYGHRGCTAWRSSSSCCAGR